MRFLALHLELPKASFEAVVDWILELRTEFDIPHTLRGLGVDDTRFDHLAALAVADPTAAGNPVELSEADCLRLFQWSYTGKLGPAE